MRLMTRRTVRAIGLAAVVVLILVANAAGGATRAQEPTPEGRLGGGAPLDATIPVATVPPTATPTAFATATATLAATPTRDPDASPSPPASPAASPTAGEAPAPVVCDDAPRSLAEVADLLMLAERPAAPPPPTAAEWSPAAAAAARAVVAELAACGNAGNQLAAYALLTDAALVEYLIGSQPNLSVIRALFFDEEPSLIPALVTGLVTRPGEPGAVYLWLDLGASQGIVARLTVARERGSWRVAGVEIAEPSASSVPSF